MKKSTIIILSIVAILCLGLVGYTGYFIGSAKNDLNKKMVNLNATTEEFTQFDDSALREEIRNELKNEVKAEVRAELYKEVKAEVMEEVQNELTSQIEELQKAEEERKKAEEEKQTEENTNQSQNVQTPAVSQNVDKSKNSDNSDNSSKKSDKSESKDNKTEPYIKVHDVTASAKDGNDGVEKALRSACDDSSGTVYTDTHNITGVGKFKIYWTSSDGAKATSYITITE